MDSPESGENLTETTITGGKKDDGPTFVQNFWNYVTAPMVYDYYTDAEHRGTVPKNPRIAWTMHLIKAILSEGFIRLFLSWVYVLVMPNVLLGTLSFMAGAAVKAGVFAAMIAALGYHTAFGRTGHLLTSWFPSSNRAFAPYRHAVPYADLWHTVFLFLAHYAFSLAGVAIGLWMTNFQTINSALPNTIFSTGGVVGAYAVTESDVWIAETVGSAFITFVWLLVTVDFHGLRTRAEVALIMFFAIFGVSVVLFPLTGANFDPLHFLAMKTILLGGNVNNGRAATAYIVAPFIGDAIAWVGWLLIALLDWQTLGTNPGIATKRAVKKPQKQLRDVQHRRLAPAKVFQRQTAGQQKFRFMTRTMNNRIPYFRNNRDHRDV